MGRLKISIFAFCVLQLALGCKTGGLTQADDYVRQSQVYYRKAVDTYKQSIVAGGETEKSHFSLGQLYYNHGDFAAAIEEFKSAKSAEAKKYLAISYFRAGNFTDALGIFGRDGMFDDEARYYHGLTCEKLNLFDSALDVYRRIKSAHWTAAASERIDIIERRTNPKLIGELDPTVSAVIGSAPSQEKYPQAGALILLCDEDIEIIDSDAQVSKLHYAVKILNERGKEEFSEAEVEYDSTYEKIELEYARTIMPDGSVFDIGSRHIRDVSKYLNFPLYSNARMFIISFPEISAGAVIEYKLKVLRNKLINKNDFVLSYPLQTQEPVISAKFTVSLPETKTLNMKLLNEKYNDFGADLKAGVEQHAGRRIYRWEFKDIPQIIPEANMPPDEQINPSIILSTFTRWEDIYNWWRELSAGKIAADNAIKNKVKALIKNLASDEEKTRVIYNFCAGEIRYVAVEYGQAGYEPHSAADIFKNKYGDCKDQAVLLVTMLREAGLDAYLVLIPTKDSYNLNPDFPSVLFDHCIAGVSLDKKPVFLDPTAETCSFGDLPAGDQGRNVLVFLDTEYKIDTTPLYPASHNVIRQTTGVKINSNEFISAKKTIFTRGNYEQSQRYWLLYTPPKLVEEALREKIQDVSIGAKLSNYKIKNPNDLDKPVVLEYEFYGSDYSIGAGNLRILPQLAGIPTAIAAQDERRYPIDFGILDIKETDYAIEIPESFSVKYIPENVREDSRWLSFSAEYKQEKNKIYFRQKIELKEVTVPREEYAEFKGFLEKLAKRVKQRIVVESVKR